MFFTLKGTESAKSPLVPWSLGPVSRRIFSVIPIFDPVTQTIPRVGPAFGVLGPICLKYEIIFGSSLEKTPNKTQIFKNLYINFHVFNGV